MGWCEKRRSKAVAAARVFLKVAGFRLPAGPIPIKLLSAEKFLPWATKRFALTPVKRCLTPASPHRCATGRIWEVSPADFLQLIA